MPKSETKSADTTQDALANKEIANLVEVLRQTQFLDYLGAHGTMLFSGACKATLITLSEARKKCIENSRRILLGEIALGDLNLFNQIRTNITHHFRPLSLLFADVVRRNEVLTKQIATKRRLLLQDPIVLLAAVVQGNEDWARAILRSNPELIRDKSATVSDLSGKEIKSLTPLQAAICAGDVEMVLMMEEVLQQQVRDGVNLGFDPEAEIARQFAQIYPEGLDAVEKTQKEAANNFKKSTLQNLLKAINAAKDAQIELELETPGLERDSSLNAALRDFRAQFAAVSNQEQIFNPFYLLAAFEFFNEKFGKFTDRHRRDMFWRLIIGYIQRHLPACYWQAFGTTIYEMVELENDKKLKRTFRFWYRPDLEMRPVDGDLNNLGFKWAAGVGWWGTGRAADQWEESRLHRNVFQKLLRTKKSGLQNLRRRSQISSSRVTFRLDA